MTRCPLLNPAKRLRLKEVLDRCQDPKLIPRATEREEKLKAALKAARNWLETRLRKREQQQATFMRNYAASMMSTAYCGPSTLVAPVRGKHMSLNTASGSNSSNSSKGSKPAKPIKLSKAEQIRQQQTAKRATEGAVRLADKWATKQQELERCVQVAGWDNRLQSEVARFLAECKQEAPAAYLAASMFALEHSMNAWKQVCQNRRRRADAAPAPQPAAAARSASDLADALPHAVAVWLTVQDIVGKGFLDTITSTGLHRELVKKAGKLCEQAMQLLDFAQTAAHISSLLTALKGTKAAKVSRQMKQASEADNSGIRTTAATAVGSAASAAHVHPAGPTALSTTEQAVESSAAPCNELQGSNSQVSGGTSRSSNSSGNKAFGVGMTEAQFQLQHCGNLLQRDAPAVPDPRVISFNPDTLPWM